MLLQCKSLLQWNYLVYFLALISYRMQVLQFIFGFFIGAYAPELYPDKLINKKRKVQFCSILIYQSIIKLFLATSSNNEFELHRGRMTNVQRIYSLRHGYSLVCKNAFSTRCRNLYKYSSYLYVLPFCCSSSGLQLPSHFEMLNQLLHLVSYPLSAIRICASIRSMIQQLVYNQLWYLV